jgi:hypothetical protein
VCLTESIEATLLAGVRRVVPDNDRAVEENLFAFWVGYPMLFRVLISVSGIPIESSAFRPAFHRI